MDEHENKKGRNKSSDLFSLRIVPRDIVLVEDLSRVLRHKCRSTGYFFLPFFFAATFFTGFFAAIFLVAIFFLGAAFFAGFAAGFLATAFLATGALAAIGAVLSIQLTI